MSLLDARSDQFDFKFPRTFIPDEINKKYSTYYSRIPGSFHSNPIDVLNFSIQGVNLGAPSFDPVTQNDNPGTTRYYRASVPEQELYDKTLNLEFKALSGWSNYWLCFEIFTHYYHSKEPFLTDGVSLHFKDDEENTFVSAEMKNMLMSSLDPLDLNYSSNAIEFKTFNLTIIYNILNIKFPFIEKEINC